MAYLLLSILNWLHNICTWALAFNLSYTPIHQIYAESYKRIFFLHKNCFHKNLFKSSFQIYYICSYYTAFSQVYVHAFSSKESLFEILKKHMVINVRQTCVVVLQGIIHCILHFNTNIREKCVVSKYPVKLEKGEKGPRENLCEKLKLWLLIIPVEYFYVLCSCALWSRNMILFLFVRERKESNKREYIKFVVIRPWRSVVVEQATATKWYGAWGFQKSVSATTTENKCAGEKQGTLVHFLVVE